MRRFLTTTALVAALAAPVAAQTNETQSQANQNGATAETEFDRSQIMASNLIDMRIYMPGPDHGTGETDQAARAGNTGANDGQTMADESGSTTDMAEADDVDGPVENEVEEAGRNVAEAAAETGQAVERTANDIETALSGDITDVPDSWQMVGEIEDLVVTRDGRVNALIVDAGGFLGIGETERRVDIRNVRFVADADDDGEYFVVFTGDRSRFEDQESYDEAAAQERGEFRASQTEQWALIEQQRQAEQAQAAAVEWANVDTDELLGSAVYGKNDEWIGDLSELNLGEDGKIDGVIIDVGGFLGLGEKAVELPLDKVTLTRVSGSQIRAHVNSTEAELESMDRWTGTDM